MRCLGRNRKNVHKVISNYIIYNNFFVIFILFYMNQPEIPSSATSHFTYLPQLPKLILIVVTDNSIQINKSKLMKHYLQKTNYDVCFALSAQSINFL